MFFSKPRLFQLPAFALLVCNALPLTAAETRHELKVKDLSYGTSLYHLFQDENMHAITALEVAKQKQTLKNQPEDAELLLGSLYFDYGLVDKSEKILTRLLDTDTSEESRNRVWFNLARVQYQNNNLQQAEQLLSQISNTLAPQRQAQKQYILTNIQLRNQQNDKAAESASLVDSDSVWSAYSEYNLGVSHNETEQNQQAQQWLMKLISRDSQDEELRSLQDAARLVAGLRALRQNQPEDSIKFLGKIQTSSPLTNKALLATGWAWSQLSEPQKALTYWLTLTDKNQHDGATQEAYLAIAYAYEQIGNNILAIQHYELALQQFDKTLVELNKASDSIAQMDLINTLYQHNIIQPGNRRSYAKGLPEHISTPFLHQMFAGKAFQQALLNYQELLEIHNSLIHWKNELPALELMLVERKNSFQGKRELVEQTTDFTQLEKLQQQRDEFAQEVHRIEQEKDYLALAGEDEVDYLEQLDDVMRLITRLEKDQELSDEIYKLKIMSGILHWEISTDYPRRYWRLFNQLQLLDRALETARQSATSLQQASAINELKLTDFNQRIEGQSSEVERMEINSAQLIDQQEQLINLLAIEAIESRELHLTQLRLSARYSLTRLYDGMSRQESVQ